MIPADRAAKVMDLIQTIAAGVAIFGGIGVSLGYVFDFLPVVKAQVYQMDRVQVNKELADHAQAISGLQMNYNDIRRTGKLSLALQLQGRIDRLSDTLLLEPKGSASAAALQNELADLRQRLAEVNRSLDR